ncbi:MAG: hypothetical protein MKZ66_09900, partial [Acidimicrobiales bacterium]|nr:hypothetical protein [Acidimicrobiales bacterium]
PWEHHAQRFGDATCVLSWAWTGDVAVNARLVPAAAGVRSRGSLRGAGAGPRCHTPRASSWTS